MSFNLKNLNMTCAPMYNAQNNNEIMGYMCNSREGFESSTGSTPSGSTIRATPSGTTTIRTTPSGSTPSGSTPSGTTTIRTTPSGSTPSGSTPSGNTPSGTTTIRTTPSGSTPSGTTPSGTTPSGSTPSGTTPSGSTIRATPSGSTPSGGTNIPYTRIGSITGTNKIFDLPQTYQPIYHDEREIKPTVFYQPVSAYDRDKIINSFLTTQSPYWIPLFDTTNFYNSETGQPNKDIISLYLTISGANTITQPSILLNKSENMTQGLSNYNNIMGWFSQYPILKPGFIINLIDYKEILPVKKSFYATIPTDKKYANYTKIEPTFSNTFSDGTPLPSGQKRLTNPDFLDQNIMMLYLGPEGTQFWKKYIDKNSNYFDDRNIKDFGKLNVGIDLNYVRIQVLVCAILPNGNLYNWSGPPSIYPPLLPLYAPCNSDNQCLSVNCKTNICAPPSRQNAAGWYNFVQAFWSDPAVNSLVNTYNFEIEKCKSKFPSVVSSINIYNKELERIRNNREKRPVPPRGAPSNYVYCQDLELNRSINKAFNTFKSNPDYKNYADCFNKITEPYFKSMSNLVFYKYGLSHDFLLEITPRLLPTDNSKISPDIFNIVNPTPNESCRN